MESLRALPSVDQVLRNLEHVDGLPHSLLIREIRAVLAQRRHALLTGGEASELSVTQEVEERLRMLLQPSMRRVINATGVILHTNLGRAPLPAFEPILGYSNLEYDLTSGKRGKRDAHFARLLDALLGKPAVVVNNNAAAVYLVLNELASGYEVIVSRGELIEIGDGFRIPDIMARSGAILREVGATNRTRMDDYRRAITDRTRLILRVHPSNFQMRGFTGRPELSELAQLGHDHGIPVYEDLGSGCMMDLRSAGLDEPVVSESLAAGAALVSFSCDKLLGGPQAGIIAGDADLVARIRRNPMYRAFRVDKLILQSLGITLRSLLREDSEAIPALRMISESLDALHARANRIAETLGGMQVEIRQDEAAIGGGSTPGQTLPTWVIELSTPDVAGLEKRLRSAAPPVIARIEHNKLIFDMRTVADQDADELIATLRGAIST